MTALGRNTPAHEMHNPGDRVGPSPIEIAITAMVSVAINAARASGDHKGDARPSEFTPPPAFTSSR